MHSPRVILCWIALVLLVAAPSAVHAGPPPALAAPVVSEKAVTLPPDASRWSIGAGIVFREIEGDFTLRSPGPPPGQLIGGLGNVGLLPQGSGRRIRYNDGSVGPGFDINDGNLNRGAAADGTAYTVTTRPGQFTNTGRSDIFGNAIYNVAFHTSLGIYNENTYQSSDDELGVGPYIELRYALFQRPKVDVNLVFGYSWVSADLGSGTGTLASYERQDFTYNYDYAFFASQTGGLLPGSPGLNLNGPFPFKDWSYAIINPNGIFGANEGYRSPHMDSEISRQLVLKGQASLDVNLHEIVLAPEILFNLGSRVHVGLLVGPTLNIIDSDLDASAAWQDLRSGRTVKSYRFSDNSTDVRLGVATQVTLMIDITQRLYFQASASYRYVPEVDVQAGFAAATIDTTAWQSTVGFGWRL